MRKVVVIGGGAAGLMATIAAAQAGAEVYLLERNDIVGKKMGITGKGRCNITNVGTVEELIQHTPGNGKFLYSAYTHFNNQDLLECLAKWGLNTKVERGGRVFPVSDSAIEVRNLLSKVVKKLGGTICLGERAVSIVCKDGQVTTVQTEHGLFEADAVILATGGVSYPVTGSSGDGHKMAKSLGLKVTPLLAALVPLETKESWVKDMMGLSLKNVRATLYYNGKKKDTQFGEMLFTHFGVSGPIILSMSRTISKALHQKKKDIILEIDFKPALSEEQLDLRIQRDFEKYKNKQLGNALRDLLPAKSIPILVRLAELTEEKVIHQVTKEERLRLGRLIKHVPLHIKATRPIEEAIVTCGGISTKDVSPKTMESKTIRGLYIAGEVLDIDAFTGGYNLQAAFSTGYIAGTAAAKEDEHA